MRGRLLLCSLALCCLSAAPLVAAQFNRDLRLTLLPTGMPLAEAAFDPDIGRWRVGLQQQHAELRPHHGLPGFSLDGSFVSIGVLRSLGFVVGSEHPTSRWNRMAVDGGATVGVIYGRAHAGRNPVHGLSGAIAGRFALQLARRRAQEGPAILEETDTPATRSWHGLTGFFGFGAAYSLVTLTGQGPNFDVGTSTTHADVGLQAAFVLSQDWSIEPFFLGSGGWQSTGIHQGGTVTGRDLFFYRIDFGAEMKLHLSSTRPADQLGFQALFTWNDGSGYNAAAAIVLHRGF